MFITFVLCGHKALLNFKKTVFCNCVGNIKFSLYF